ncbi:flavodoxin [Megasphaera stantonii]|uniref:Flavodoxin n=1 Tax=Megasphaera stantonii TaxID=2144175 RepID=A0A346AX77_9FIRM|nr:flavodoxin [Megasphaera stantonii]AXL20470.1 flavodoxin [Megasphaera stantonii]
MNKRKLAALLLAAMTALTVTACATSDTASQQETKPAAQQTKPVVDADASASIKGAAVPEAKSGGQSRVAVVYFSEPETAQKYDVQGSTQYVAQVIQDKTGADIFRIERQVDYPTDHDALTDQAKSEREQGVHPAIKDTIGDLSRYDTIFLGYPIWWYDAPMPVYTFLDNYDLSGKQIYVFATHGGSGLTGTVERLQAAEPGAQFGSSAFAVYRTDIASTSPIYAWLGNLGYK